MPEPSDTKERTWATPLKGSNDFEITSSGTRGNFNLDETIREIL